MEFIVPDWPGMPAAVGALSTLRRGGVSRSPYDDGSGGGGLNLGTHVNDNPADVAANRALLRSLLPAEPSWLSQVHGSRVVDAFNAIDAPEADACIATTSGVVCAIQTADCLPVLLCDLDARVVGAAHAGWRGLANGVLESTIERMKNAGAGEIAAWLGPAIGPERFEVGQDVLAAFVQRDALMGTAFKPVTGCPGKYLADIFSLARMTLNKAGVSKIYGGGLCTVTDESRFYSYRRDKVTGRMASLIWLK